MSEREVVSRLRQLQNSLEWKYVQRKMKINERDYLEQLSIVENSRDQDMFLKGKIDEVALNRDILAEVIDWIEKGEEPEENIKEQDDAEA